tara:strand:- start:306 stop:572 length:267 start_codon:yes stop_codon:yes gene_type:complete
MAITKTSKMLCATVYPAADNTAGNEMNIAHPTIEVTYEITLDDSSDSELPIVQTKSHMVYRYISDSGSATDVSAENPLVQSIAGSIWT